MHYVTRVSFSHVLAFCGDVVAEIADSGKCRQMTRRKKSLNVGKRSGHFHRRMVPSIYDRSIYIPSILPSSVTRHMFLLGYPSIIYILYISSTIAGL